MRHDSRDIPPKRSERFKLLWFFVPFWLMGLILLGIVFVSTACLVAGTEYDADVENVWIGSRGGDGRGGNAWALYRYTVDGHRRRSTCRITWDLYDRWNEVRKRTPPGEVIVQTRVRAWGRPPFHEDEVAEPGGRPVGDFVGMWAFSVLWNGIIFWFTMATIFSDRPRRRRRRKPEKRQSR